MTCVSSAHISSCSKGLSGRDRESGFCWVHPSANEKPVPLMQPPPPPPRAWNHQSCLNMRVDGTLTPAGLWRNCGVDERSGTPLNLENREVSLKLSCESGMNNPNGMKNFPDQMQKLSQDQRKWFYCEKTSSFSCLPAASGTSCWWSQTSSFRFGVSVEAVFSVGA